MIGVDYKYNITVKAKANFSGIVSKIESQLLSTVSDVIMHCDETHRLSRRLVASILAVSSFPEDVEAGNCGVQCTKMEGGMTLDAADDGSSFTEVQCKALAAIREMLGNLPSEIDGLESAAFVEGSDVDCGNVTGSDSGGIIAAAVSGQTISGKNDIGHGTIAGIAVAGAAFLLILALLVARRRRNNQHDSEFVAFATGKDGDWSSGTPDTRDIVSPMTGAHGGGGLFFNSKGEQLIINLNVNDLLLDKSSSPREHDGNTRLRALAASRKVAYQNADENQQESIAHGLVSQVKSSDGRFLINVEPLEAYRCGVPSGIDAWGIANDATAMIFVHRMLNFPCDGIVTQLNDHDVLLDKCSGPMEAQGNTRLRALIKANNTSFQSANSEVDKLDIAYKILDTVHLNGGRFLKKVDAAEAKRAGISKGVEVWRGVDDDASVDLITGVLAGDEDDAIITQINAFDVLLEGGKDHFENEGNTRLRGLVNGRKVDYTSATEIVAKEAIAFTIIDKVKADGGRFLKKVEGITANRESFVVSKGVDSWRAADDQNALDFMFECFAGDNDKIIAKLNVYDVLLSKSSGPFEHEGNTRIRALVNARKASFADSGQDSVKEAIAREIMKKVEIDGGRFLDKLDTSEATHTGNVNGDDKWRLADSDAAMSSIMQMLDGVFDEVITQVGVHDVLVDRPTSSVLAAKHEGNGRFRRLIFIRQAQFLSASDVATRKSVARDILAEVIANGGRFLTKVSSSEATNRILVKDTWNTMGDEAALEFIQQTLAGQNDEGRAALSGLWSAGLAAEAQKAAKRDQNAGGCLSIFGLGSLLGGRKRKHNSGFDNQVWANGPLGQTVLLSEQRNRSDEVFGTLDLETTDVHICTSSTCVTCQSSSQVKMIKVKAKKWKSGQGKETLNLIPEQYTGSVVL